MITNTKRSNGFTLIELVVVVTLVSILASSALQVLQLSVQRTKESELKANLRQIREAIDAYKKAVDEGHIKKTIEQTGYPPNLEVLVEGVQDDKTPNHKKMKFLRSIPVDPMSASTSWGLRSYSSDADHPMEGDDVYDVYSLSNQVGINGIPYKQW